MDSEKLGRLSSNNCCIKISISRMKSIKFLLLTLLFPMYYAVCQNTDSSISQSTVAIVEVLYDSPLNEVITKPNYSHGEFISFLNYGKEPVDLSAWQITDGGKETFVFPTGTILMPQAVCIVAFRGSKNKTFTLDSVYTNAREYGWNLLLYQDKLILSNAGESLLLRDAYGRMVDAMTYDGTSKAPDSVSALRAPNSSGMDGDKCVSLQRIRVGNKPALRSDFVKKPVKAFSFVKEIASNTQQFIVSDTNCTIAPIMLSPLDAPSGSHQVTTTGAFSYDIPIEVPAGIDDFIPRLSLSYNSQNPTGLLGVGFSLSGLSQICREGARFHYDAVGSSVFDDSVYRFSFNGQRLELISGIYGQDGSQYEMSESPGFIQILYTERSLPGFIVRSKDGVACYYGGNENALIRDSGGKIYSYLLREVHNASGLSIRYVYNTQRGRSYLKKIEYNRIPLKVFDEGSSLLSLRSGNSFDLMELRGSAELEFIYEKKAGNYSYLNGERIWEDSLLKGVRCMIHGEEHSSYHFAYKYQNTQFPLLQKVERSYRGNFLPPVLFGWTGEIDFNSRFVDRGTFSEEIRDDNGNVLTEVSNMDICRLGDFDGDGKTDVLMPQTGIYVSRTNGNLERLLAASHESDTTMWSYVGKKEAAYYVYDVNQDGLDDILVCHRGGTSVFINGGMEDKGWVLHESFRIASLKSIKKTENPDKGIWFVPQLYFGDFDGDGSKELFAFSVPSGDHVEKRDVDWVRQIYCYKEGKYELEKQVGGTISKKYGSCDLVYFLVADIDKDGKDEIMQVHQVLAMGTDPVHPDVQELLWIGFYDNLDQNEPDWTCVCPCVGMSYKAVEMGSAGERYQIYLQDMNADGYPDLVVLSERGVEVYENGGEERLFGIKNHSLETTTSTFATKALTTKGQWKDSEKNSILFVDVNGDGLTDILAFDKDSIYWIQNMGGCFAPVRTEENFYTSECSRMLGNFDGDNDMDLLLIPKKGKLRFLMREHETKGLPKITKIREGWNRPPLHIEYGFSQRENGRNEAYNRYPLAQLNRLEVVSSIYRQSGDEIRDRNEYRYMDGLYHKGKSAFLGFAKVESTSPQGHVSLSEYGVDATGAILLPQKEETPFSLKTYVYGFDTSYYGKPYQILTSTQVVDKLTNTQERLFNQYDRYGNLTLERHLIGAYDGQKKLVWETEEATRYRYAPYGVWKIPNVCVEKITEGGYIGKPALADTVFMDYDRYGRLISSRDRTGSTLYDYYSTGLLRNQTYLSAANPEAALRQIFEYTADHRFLKAHTDTTGTQTYRYDSISGLLLEKQDVRGRKTSYEYDKWGYLSQTIDPDGYRTLHKKGWATSVHPAGACLVVEEKTTPGATLQWYYDKWGNEIGKSNTIGDKRSYTRKIYDKWSRLTGVSEPDFNPTGGMLHLYEYDKENRLKQEIFGNRITTYQYNGLLSEVTQPNGITHVELKNHTGDVIRSQDFIPDGEEVEIVYEYGYPGKMSSVTADGVETRMAYDSYGRQISLSDPSAGVTTFDYNVSDELTHSRDAEGINTTYAYDIQGRETKMQVGDAKVDFRYGNEGNGKELLVEKSLNNGSRFEYQYDEAGRLTKKTLYKGDTAYTFAYVYDSFGRMVETCYPNGYSVYYVYDGQDNVSRITDNRSRVLWKNPVYDAYGRVVSYEFGEGLRYNVRYNEYGRTTETEYTGADNAKLYVERYTFDSVSQNLLSRSFIMTETFPVEEVENNSAISASIVTERFRYDGWNRLVYSGIGKDSIAIQYDKKGNILSKSDVGEYGYSPDKPYAVNGIGIGGESGALVERLLTQRITYTPFKRVYEIEQQKDDNGVSRQIKAKFSYNPDFERMTMERSSDGLGTVSTFYFENYEEKRKDDRIIEYCYVFSPVGLLAVHTEEKDVNSQHLYYLASDYMGSIRAIMTENGTVVERLEFDPWGKRRSPYTHKPVYRNAPDWTEDGQHFFASLIERGFCGQEHIDEFDLINLNARLYDPVLCRFLNPDPFVQDYKNAQNLNRYSYALNNPFNHTDPTGNFIEPMSWVMVGVMALISGITNVACHAKYTTHVWQDFAMFGIGTIIGAASSLAGIGLAGVTNATGFIWGAIAGGPTSALISAGISPLQTMLNNVTLDNPFNMNLGKRIVWDVISGFFSGFISGGVQGALAAKAQGLSWFDGSETLGKYKSKVHASEMVNTEDPSGGCYWATAYNADKNIHRGRTDVERNSLCSEFIWKDGKKMPTGSFPDVANALGLDADGRWEYPVANFDALKELGEKISSTQALVEYFPAPPGRKYGHVNNVLSMRIKRVHIFGKVHTSLSIHSWDANWRQMISRFSRKGEISDKISFWFIKER